MKVIAWSPNLTPERAQAADVDYVETKAELFKQSDIVSIHMVLSDTTRHMITYEDLVLMKSTAFFINISRGPLVDENALIKILEEERIAGAGLDVFDIEPLPLDHPIRSLKRVTLSPHTGYLTDSNYAVSIHLSRHTVYLMSLRYSGERQWRTLSIFWTVNQRNCSKK